MPYHATSINSSGTDTHMHTLTHTHTIFPEKLNYFKKPSACQYSASLKVTAC